MDLFTYNSHSTINAHYESPKSSIWLNILGFLEDAISNHSDATKWKHTNNHMVHKIDYGLSALSLLLLFLQGQKHSVGMQLIKALSTQAW